MSTDPHVGALWNFDEGYGVYVYHKIQGIRMTSSHIRSTTIRVPSMELEIVASVSSANLDVAINMESVIACGLAQSDSDLYGAVTSCSVLTAEGVGLCERDTPGGLPEVPTEAPVTEQTPTDELTTQAPVTDDDDDTADDTGSTGVVTGTTIGGYGGDGCNTNNPGVYGVTDITPGANSTNDEPGTTQIVTEKCFSDVTSRYVDSDITTTTS